MKYLKLVLLIVVIHGLLFLLLLFVSMSDEVVTKGQSLLAKAIKFILGFPANIFSDQPLIDFESTSLPPNLIPIVLFNVILQSSLVLLIKSIITRLFSTN